MEFEFYVQFFLKLGSDQVITFDPKKKAITISLTSQIQTSSQYNVLRYYIFGILISWV